VDVTRRWLARQTDPYWRRLGADWIALFEQLRDNSLVLRQFEGERHPDAAVYLR
jgi:hypothetical protein